MKKMIIALCTLVVTGCGTMKFENGPKMEETVVREQWHHLGFNGLIEFSKPMNVDYNCANQQWDSITVERTFINGLASLSWPYVSIYSPWTIVYECREPID